MNLIRGAGAVGLSPFKEKNAQHLARPLLSFSRKDIEAFLLSEAIPSRTDRSNHSKRFTRNRIRHEVIPLLETFNPSVIQTLATTDSRISVRPTSQYPLVTKRVVSDQPVHTFSRPAFCKLSSEDQEQFLHDVFRALSSDGKSPSQRFITECTRVINSSRPGPKTLQSGRLKCQCFHDRIETTLN
jgi:tRNA(Ile)-lysidine synthase TilS/MesJ